MPPRVTTKTYTASQSWGIHFLHLNSTTLERQGALRNENTSIIYVSRKPVPVCQGVVHKYFRGTSLHGAQDGLKPSVALQFWGPVKRGEGVDTQYLGHGPAGWRVTAEAFPTSAVIMGYP